MKNKIRWIAAFAAGVLLLAQMTFARAEGGEYLADGSRTFWFLQLTDTHVSTWFNTQYGARLVWAVTDAVETIDPRFVVVTGDLTDSTAGFDYTQGPQLSEWLEYRGYLESNGMTPEFYFDLPGNHDAYQDGALAYYLANSISGHAYRTTQPFWRLDMPYGSFGFIGVATPDNNGPPWPGDGSKITDWEAEEVMQHLDDLGETRFAMAFGHHPLEEVENADDLFSDLMDRAGCLHYACGHKHDLVAKVFEATGTFQFRISSLGQKTTDNIGIYAVDNDTLSLGVTSYEDPWPAFVITAPGASRYESDDPMRGTREIAEHPYAPPVSTNCDAAPVRVLAFDPSGIDAVRMRVNGGGWIALSRMAQIPKQWRGVFDARPLSEGHHVLEVEVTGSEVRHRSQFFRAADIACEIGAEDPGEPLDEGEIVTDFGPDGDGETDGDADAENEEEPSDGDDTPDGDAEEPDCVEEGGSAGVFPDAPACCAGLSSIGCDRPDEDGVCPQGCEGSFVCARCGNGLCGPGENICNCPADCTEAPDGDADREGEEDPPDGDEAADGDLLPEPDGDGTAPDGDDGKSRETDGSGGGGCRHGGESAPLLLSALLALLVFRRRRKAADGRRR